MYMHPYFIQYSSTYPSYGASKRPIVASNNLVKSKPDCSKEGEKDMKQDNQYLQPRWCPSALSHTQKRRLQRMRKKEYGIASGGCTSKIGDHEAGMEA